MRLIRSKEHEVDGEHLIYVRPPDQVIRLDSAQACLGSPKAIVRCIVVGRLHQPRIGSITSGCDVGIICGSSCSRSPPNRHTAMEQSGVAGIMLVS